MRTMHMLFLSLLFASGSCEKEDPVFNTGDYKILVLTGEEWIHPFPLPLGFEKKNPPQFVIWTTDLDTNYLTTIYCTEKTATEAWAANKGNRRKEALPYWCHNRGVVYDDGLLLPTRDEPLTDGTTGATPSEDCIFRMVMDREEGFLLFAEFNHSTDFNTIYSEDAPEGTFEYSGGSEGSGQPALIYSVIIDPPGEIRNWEMELIGHSSPDGTDGKRYTDLSGITSANNIVEAIKIELIP